MIPTSKSPESFHPVSGRLLSQRAEPQFEPRGHYHWFTGDGMIHAFFVEDGKVAYRNRYVRTPKWELEHAAGKALFGGFDPRAADPSVMGKDSGVANTNVVWHAGRLLALGARRSTPTDVWFGRWRWLVHKDNVVRRDRRGRPSYAARRFRSAFQMVHEVRRGGAMRGGPAYAWEPDKGTHVG